MSNAAILYLRLLRKIVRESAWRLGGGEETFLAGGFGGSDGSKHGGGEAPVIHGRGDAATRPTDRIHRTRDTERDSNGTVRIQNPACGGKLRAGKPGNRQTKDGNRHSKPGNRHK